jgi:hypothetical protein
MDSDEVTMELLWSLYGVGIGMAFGLARRGAEDAGKTRLLKE